MDKKIAGLLGAAAALTAINTITQATPAQNTELAPATTYRDLLNPVPNALSALKADNARLSRDQANGPTRMAQVSVQVGHHHHHHHHGVRIRVGHIITTITWCALDTTIITITCESASTTTIDAKRGDLDSRMAKSQNYGRSE
jgi:hypothetical protein